MQNQNRKPKAGRNFIVRKLKVSQRRNEGDIAFAEELSKLADCYINDAFGTAHRAHASTTIIAQFLNTSSLENYLKKKFYPLIKS